MSRKKPAKVGTKGAPEPFDRFEKLTRKLVSVPKKEIDAQRERDARSKHA